MVGLPFVHRYRFVFDADVMALIPKPVSRLPFKSRFTSCQRLKIAPLNRLRHHSSSWSRWLMLAHRKLSVTRAPYTGNSFSPAATSAQQLSHPPPLQLRNSVKFLILQYVCTSSEYLCTYVLIHTTYQGACIRRWNVIQDNDLGKY